MSNIMKLKANDLTHLTQSLVRPEKTDASDNKVNMAKFRRLLEKLSKILTDAIAWGGAHAELCGPFTLKETTDVEIMKKIQNDNPRYETEIVDSKTSN